MQRILTDVYISMHWFRQWLGAVRQQAITCANADLDLCRHLALPGLVMPICVVELDRHRLTYVVCVSETNFSEICIQVQ